MQQRTRRWRHPIGVLACVVLALTGCAQVVSGKPTVASAPNAHLAVKGTDGGTFDQIVQNSLTDIEAFWKREYPKISGGKSLTPLAGGLYSVDGLEVARTRQLSGPITQNKCAQQAIAFVVDNGAFCPADDSISWDRAPTHLFAKLGDKYGALTVALIFAHEFGHAISFRQGIFSRDLPTYWTEQQADCAAGAWAASALAGQDPHFRNTTPATLDDALEGFLNGRDSTPNPGGSVSHGNGFDRLSMVANGIQRGASYCFGKNFFNSVGVKAPTERPYSTTNDYASGGNSPLTGKDGVLAPNGENQFVLDLNRFWKAQAQRVDKTFTPVSIAPADHPPCQSSSVKFGYCSSTNTVYYNADFARSVYYSLPEAVGSSSGDGNVELLDNQPADFALGTLFAMGWGMAIRHQFFGRPLDNSDALRAAVCYTGAYAEDINIPQGDPRGVAEKLLIYLSPPDLDEATSSMLTQVNRPGSFGARGTTGLDRVQEFVKGYRGTLRAC